MELMTAGVRVTLPPPRGLGRWHRLRQTPHGTLYRARLLDVGTYTDPVTGQQVHLGADRLDALRTNIAAKAAGYVPIQSAHSEDPDDCIGEVVGLEANRHGLDALCDFRRAAPGTRPPTGALVATLSLDYTNDTGRRVGPTLLSVVLLGRPYLPELDELDSGDRFQVVRAGCGRCASCQARSR